MSNSPKLLVVGGGFAGCTVAKAATAAGYEVVVIDRFAHRTANGFYENRDHWPWSLIVLGFDDA